jgi:hypothetical protein
MAKLLELRFPMAGVVRRAGYGSSAEQHAAAQSSGYGSPWSLNCRPQDVFLRRRRGGSRPGLASGGNPVPPPRVRVAGNAAIAYNEATGIYAQVVATSGAMPATFSFGDMYRGRLLLASGNGIYASRLGNVSDWDYGSNSEDGSRATVLQLSEAGEYGGDVTAIVPHKDLHLLAATTGGLWHLAGDPVTGSLRNVSRTVGMVGAKAWTKVGDAVVFMSADGVHSVSADGGKIEDLSLDKIPDELRNLDGDSVLLAYNEDEKGIYIFVEGGDYHWFYDLVAGGFWPMTLETVPNKAAVVDGVLRLAHDELPMTIGATESITSHVLIGPLRLGSPNDFGMIQNLHGMLSAESGAVTWRIVAGDTAEDAVENGKAAIAAFQAGSSYAGYVKADGIWAAGRSFTEYPRVCAMWACLWLQSLEPWAYEGVTMETMQAGRWR